MPREIDGFRDELERIIGTFGNVGMIPLSEAAQYIGMSERSLKSTALPTKVGGRYMVSTTRMAQFVLRGR